MSSATFYNSRAKYGGMDAIHDRPDERARGRKSAAEKDLNRGTPQGGDRQEALAKQS